jgi:hypothetical protein
MLILCINFKFIKTYNLLQLLEKEKENLCQKNLIENELWVQTGGTQYPCFLGWVCLLAHVMVQTVLEIKISCNQWEGSARTKEGLVFFFSFELEGGGEGLFWFCLGILPMCSHQVLKGFPTKTQRVPQGLDVFLKMFPIAPNCYPISFVQSWTYT